jgi:hypothetical protein
VLVIGSSRVAIAPGVPSGVLKLVDWARLAGLV